MTLALDLHEAWLLRDYVRRHQDYGLVWSRDDMRRVHEALLYLRDNPAGSYELQVDEAFLWLIEQQIPSTAMVGTQPTGRTLLLKVMSALSQGEEVVEDDSGPGLHEIGQPFRAAFEADDVAAADFEAFLVEREGGS